MVEKSKVIGIMLQHSDGDKEYYEPELSKEDIEAIFKILYMPFLPLLKSDLLFPR